MDTWRQKVVPTRLLSVGFRAGVENFMHFVKICSAFLLKRFGLLGMRTAAAIP